MYVHRVMILVCCTSFVAYVLLLLFWSRSVYEYLLLFHATRVIILLAHVVPVCVIYIEAVHVHAKKGIQVQQRYNSTLALLNSTMAAFIPVHHSQIIVHSVLHELGSWLMLLCNGNRILDTVGICVVFCKVWCSEYHSVCCVMIQLAPDICH